MKATIKENAILHKATIFLLTVIMVLTAAMTAHADDVISPNALLDMAYPVGSYYHTTDTGFDPNTAWGGTWEQETDGRVLIASNSTYTLGSTGGETTHILTPSETAVKNHSHTVDSHSHWCPGVSGSTSTDGNHTHAVPRSGSMNGGNARYSVATGSEYIGTEGNGAHSHGIATYASTTGNASPNTNSTTDANGNAHNNMMPYLAVVRWHRTA